MDREESMDSQNILQIIDTKLKVFRRKKLLLEQKINTDKEEIREINSNIEDLQLKLTSTSKNIQKSETQLLELDKVIDNIDEGYKNIIESGQTLMALVELPNE
mgnify:CR=1 FL=1